MDNQRGPSHSHRSDTPNNDEETKRETDIKRQRVGQLTRKKPPDIFADADAAAAAGGQEAAWERRGGAGD
jgi:hypothetical protein